MTTAEGSALRAAWEGAPHSPSSCRSSRGRSYRLSLACANDRCVPETPAVIGTIRVDFCSRCQGFHLDRGELDAAVKSARARGASARHVLAMAAKALS